MVPEKYLTSVDIYRDGGSLGAWFTTGLDFYELFFQISYHDQTIENRPVFTQAVLKTRIRVSWTSKVTGKTDTWFEWEEKDITWAEARSILSELQEVSELPFREEAFDERYVMFFDQMIEVAKTEGTGFKYDEYRRPIA